MFFNREWSASRESLWRPLSCKELFNKENPTCMFFFFCCLKTQDAKTDSLVLVSVTVKIYWLRDIWSWFVSFLVCKIWFNRDTIPGSEHQMAPEEKLQQHMCSALVALLLSLLKNKACLSVTTQSFHFRWLFFCLFLSPPCCHFPLNFHQLCFLFLVCKSKH